MNKPVLLFAALVLVVAGCGGGGDAEHAAGEETTTARGEPFDQAFIDAMVPHHREAIEMAKAAQTRGLTEPDLEEIAGDIIDSQQGEIGQMLDWREEWFGSRQLGPVLPEALGVPESELGMEHGSADEISGAMDVDKTFAEMMIPHHEGAIAMAEQAQERGEHDEVKDLAKAIVNAQEREIEIMEKHASGMDHG